MRHYFRENFNVKHDVNIVCSAQNMALLWFYISRKYYYETIRYCKKKIMPTTIKYRVSHCYSDNKYYYTIQFQSQPEPRM